MILNQIRFLSLLAPIFTLLACSNGAAQEAVTTPQGLKRGINLPDWTRWQDRKPDRFRPADFQRIKASGFDFVRLVISAVPQLADDGSLNPAWLKTLDGAVQNATDAGLKIIIDEHDFDYCAVHGDDCRAKLPKIWKALAEHYRNAPQSVLFELLNEPKGEMNDRWSDTTVQLISVIRATNPDRTIVVGPSHSYRHTYLDEMKLPENDRNLLVTFHYYLPMEFTHQGAPWSAETKSLKGITWGSAPQRQELTDNFATIARWSRTHRRPMLLGEFGAYDEVTPPAQLSRYNAAVAREAEKHGFAWAYWQFMGFNDFSAQWNKHMTPVLKALVPGKGAPTKGVTGKNAGGHAAD